MILLLPIHFVHFSLVPISHPWSSQNLGLRGHSNNAWHFLSTFLKLQKSMFKQNGIADLKEKQI